jgi:hypothetical protein
MSSSPSQTEEEENVMVEVDLQDSFDAVQSIFSSVSPKHTLAALSFKDKSSPRTTPSTPLSLCPRSGVLVSNSANIFRRSNMFSSKKSSPQQFGITYVDIETALGKGYVDNSNNHMSSNALDVLALYIKGQKLLYTEAKTYCEQQLNFLMLPAIFISCVGSIFSFLADKYSYGPIIIASLNGFNAFLLALISYLKLDAKAQAHKTSAYKFDKLESICEFNSGKFMFFEAKPEDIFKVVERIENDVEEIKETNQFILPESIRYEFHYTYSTNIFTVVKRMQSRELAELHNLTNCANKLSSLKTQLDFARTNGNDDSSIKSLTDTMNLEESRRDEFVANVLRCRKEYYDLDRNFNMEIEMHMKRANKWFITRVLCCDWLKS